MGETPIQYVDRSVNPVRARHKVTGRRGHWCEKVSAGCAHCYSSEWQPFRGTGCAFEIPNRDQVEIYFEPKAMDEVRRRRIPTRWFWCDMTDFWGAWVPDTWIDQMFAIMAQTPHHTHLWPTKRPQRMLAYCAAMAALTPRQRSRRLAGSMYREHPAERLAVGTLDDVDVGELTWPLPNVHLAVSVENQATADERIPLLLQTPASVRWVSYEPALGPVDFQQAHAWACHEHHYQCTPSCDGKPGIRWIVVGGESGPGARHFDLAWARSTIAQCRAAGVACFVKQLGARPIVADSDFGHLGAYTREAQDGSNEVRFHDRKGGEMAEWPEDLKVREFPR